MAPWSCGDAVFAVQSAFHFLVAALPFCGDRDYWDEWYCQSERLRDDEASHYRWGKYDGIILPGKSGK